MYGKVGLIWGSFNDRLKKALNPGTFDSATQLVRILMAMNQTQLCASLLGKGSYERTDAPYALLEIAGPDAGEFLQRLCTQDIQSLQEGSVAPAAFLNAKGKLQVTVLVLRRGESFWLETQTEQASTLQALLERYHFNEKLTIKAHNFGPVSEHIEGQGAESFVGDCHWSDEAEGPLLHVERRGIAFTRFHGGVLLGAEADDDTSDQHVTPSPMSLELAEAARMLSGFVRVGLETEASTLALEADLDDHCSTTKGCYTGQEIVARIHTYGHVNRKLCLLTLPTGVAIEEPLPLHELEDDIPVGRVMHAMCLSKQAIRLGLGYLPNDYQAIGSKLSLAGDGEVEVIGFTPMTAADQVE